MNPQIKAFKERVKLTDEEINKLLDKYEKEDPFQKTPFDKILIDNQLQNILKDKQVALVVERELPTPDLIDITNISQTKKAQWIERRFGYREAQQDMLKAGYKPVILLRRK